VFYSVEPPAQPAAAILVSQKTRILDLWERRVRRAAPSARQQRHPLLRDSIPAFLDELARALAGGGAPGGLHRLEAEFSALRSVVRLLGAEEAAGG
jgi:hypothetical protein